MFIILLFQAAQVIQFCNACILVFMNTYNKEISNKATWKLPLKYCYFMNNCDKIV